MYRLIFTAAPLASLALARTDLSGCTSTDVSSPAGASIAWYVPGTGEICSILDCGGGRAPPKLTVPGCAAYTGTASYSPSYLPGYGSDAVLTPAPAAATSSAAAAASPSDYAEETAPVYSSVESSVVGSVVTSNTLAAVLSSASTAITSPSVYTTRVPIVGGGSNSTAGSARITGGVGSGNGSYGGPSSSVGPIQANGGAKVWVGSAAVVGLGALVAVL